VGWGNAKFEVCGKSCGGLLTKVSSKKGHWPLKVTLSPTITSLRHGCKRPRWPEESAVCGTSTPDEFNFQLQAPKNHHVPWLNVTTSSSLMSSRSKSSRASTVKLAIKILQ